MIFDEARVLLLAQRQFQGLSHFSAQVSNYISGTRVSYETHTDHLVPLSFADRTCVVIVALVKRKQQIYIFRGNDVHDG